MKKSIKQFHSWDVSPKEAIALQNRLREQVIIQPLPDDIELVAGADVSFNKYSPVVYAAFVVLQLPELKVIATAGVETKVTFPYIPGLLSFREAPPLLEAWERLAMRPDVVMFDGQGIAHPRRVGIASHMGLVLGLPTIGCGKSLLTGKYEEPPETTGSWSLLMDKGETIGAVVRTKNRTSPVYISPGHMADIQTSMALTLRCVKGYAAGEETTGKAKGSKYRIPEPTRLAHLFVNALRRNEAWQPPKI
ncbi:MAG: deoxyribonuclease V [Acidobacteriota bacterium]